MECSSWRHSSKVRWRLNLLQIRREGESEKVGQCTSRATVSNQGCHLVQMAHASSRGLLEVRALASNPDYHPGRHVSNRRLAERARAASRGLLEPTAGVSNPDYRPVQRASSRGCHLAPYVSSWILLELKARASNPGRHHHHLLVRRVSSLGYHLVRYASSLGYRPVRRVRLQPLLQCPHFYEQSSHH